MQDQQSQSPLADPLCREALLRCLSEGASKTESAGAVGMSIRAVQRYVRTHPEFAQAVERAVEAGLSGPRSPLRDDSLEGPARPPAESPPPPTASAPSSPVVLEAVPEDMGAARVTIDPDDSGLPPFSEEHLLAESWRIFLDNRQSAAVHAVHARALHAYFREKRRADVLARLAAYGIASRAEDAGAAPDDRVREAGVPASVWEEARQKFLGPAPEPDAASDGAVVEFDRGKGGRDTV